MSARVYPHPRVSDVHQRATQTRGAAGLLAGRPSFAADRARANSASFGGIIPRQNLDDWTPRYGSTALDTLRMVRDRDPDAAQAVSNMLLLMGQGYCISMETEAGAVHPQAQADAEAWDAQVGSDYGGGMDALNSVFGLTLLTQGALAGELELTKDLRDVVNVHPLDPARFSFVRGVDGVLKQGVFVGKGKAGADTDGLVPFPPAQVRYVPLHPDVDSPYGRSPLLAALTAIFFKIQLFEDLKAVVHNQGYPRLNVTVLQDMVLQAIPPEYNVPGKEAERQAWVNAFMTSLTVQYSALEVDDSFIHWDSVTVGYVAPPSGTGVNVDALMKVLDTQIVAGLKQLPVLLGRNDGATTTHATIQLRVYALFVNGMQRVVKRFLEWVHTSRAQIKGYVGVHAHVTFDPLPTSDRMIDVQARETELRTWIAAIDAGLVDRNEASQALYGHDAVAAPTSSASANQPPTGRSRVRGAGVRAPGSLVGPHHRAPADRVTRGDLPAVLDDPAVLDSALKLLENAQA